MDETEDVEAGRPKVSDIAVREGHTAMGFNTKLFDPLRPHEDTGGGASIQQRGK